MKLKSDHGNVLVEFICVAIFLLIPISQIAISVSNFAQKYLVIESTANAATRAFVVQGDDQRAQKIAAQLVRDNFRSQHIDGKVIRLKISCSSRPCLTAGNFVTVSLTGNIRIEVPILGSFRAPVQVSHTLEVDEQR